MKRMLFERMEDLSRTLDAAAFAELGSWNAARRILDEESHSEGQATPIARAAEPVSARGRASFPFEDEEVRPDDCQYGDNDLCFKQSE